MPKHPWQRGQQPSQPVQLFPHGHSAPWTPPATRRSPADRMAIRAAVAFGSTSVSGGIIFAWIIYGAISTNTDTPWWQLGANVIGALIGAGFFFTVVFGVAAVFCAVRDRRR